MQRVRSAILGRHRVWIATCAIALLAIAPAAFGQAAKKAAPPAATPPASTLDRVRKTGSLRLGYAVDARPFSYRDQGGQVTGYSVDLCNAVAEAVKSEVPGVKVEWVPVDRFQALPQGQVDVLCGAVVTLARRKEVAFSTPIFPGGVGVLVRSDAPARLRETLSGHAQTFRPNWRASANQVLREQTFAVVTGTTAEEWLNKRRTELKVDSKIAPVAGFEAGVQAVLGRKANGFFAERAILLDAAKREHGLTVIDRLFTYEPLALAMARGDEDFRLLVDRALSQTYASAGFGTLYAKWFGEPDEAALAFFRWNALAE